MTEENKDLETQEAAIETQDSAEEALDTRDLIAQELDKIEAGSEEGKVPEAKPEPEAKKEPEQDKPAEQPEEKQEDTKPARNPFNAWKKEAQEELSKLPEHVQKMIQDRENQFHKGTEQYKEAANFGKVINKAIAPHADYMRQLGVTPDVAFSTLLTTERTLRTGSDQEKINMFQKLAHDYGINLEQISQLPFDPQKHQLEQYNQYLERKLETQNATQQSAEDEMLLSEIGRVSQELEYYDILAPKMASILESGLARGHTTEELIKDAHAKALRLDDQLFAKHQAKQQEQARREQALRDDYAAKTAKSAAVSLKGAPVGARHTQEPATTQEAVELAMRALGI
jgi:hypothetical protein